MSLKDSTSGKLFDLAKEYMPGGVNSPVRAFKAVNRSPLFIKKAEGSKIFDADDNEYIDLICSWGALILGHSHPQVIGEVKKALDYGTSYGLSHEAEIKIAREITRAVPSIERVRMVNSGTEAVMSAIRLARGFTGKKKIIKFEGCYHGHFDPLLVKAGSGAMTLSMPDSKGVPPESIENTILLPYNDLDEFEKAVKKTDDISCVIVEPVAGNMGVIPPKDGFLQGMREITRDNDILLIFDEVITGFRLCYGGAQDYYKISPDITCLGKVIGGGFPVGAYGGRADIMEYIAPEGPVYQAGTLSGNPIALTAGLTTLELLKDGGVYENLRKNSKRLRDGIREIATEAGVDAFVSGAESMSCIFFTPDAIHDYKSAKKSDTKKYAAFFNKMLEEGILLPPSQFESLFISDAHTKEDIDTIIEATEKGFAEVKSIR
ncbi:MAG: glutamate-1-semialdehyde 2,1-aminomutase [Candidatus Altiarchaeales archaeon]|nr:glutamate-1-semialdehyde 2,1-aminomutase [Candidatus Altiarchaeota archaeon]MBU4436878.1 glutamate-1-semialdehyde 2,1-aminomutase [Candidatus Altiarchaeota archaeon]MCG2782176.1 glutamate-1-semialdehyde 2,1-aminomutase [Candidatus Altiarchaeales archaeon]